MQRRLETGKRQFSVHFRSGREGERSRLPRFLLSMRHTSRPFFSVAIPNRAVHSRECLYKYAVARMKSRFRNLSGVAAYIAIGHFGSGEDRALLKNVSDGQGAVFGLSRGSVRPDM
jgi:hypothetical protein